MRLCDVEYELISQGTSLDAIYDAFFTTVSYDEQHIVHRLLLTELIIYIHRDLAGITVLLASSLTLETL